MQNISTVLLAEVGVCEYSIKMIMGYRNTGNFTPVLNVQLQRASNTISAEH